MFGKEKEMGVFDRITKYIESVMQSAKKSRLQDGLMANDLGGPSGCK
jgi:hypothetical protein